MTYIILILIILLIIYVLISYNSFVKLNNNVKESFSTMDVYLKKRWDLIPNLVETVKGYTKYESTTLEKIAQLRTPSYDKLSLSDKINANQQLSTEIFRLMAVAENYPELKANQNFSDLTKQLSQIEDEIANSRKYYNAIVKNLNIKVEMFPSNIIAKIFNFKPSKMFEIDDNQRNNIKVEL